MIRLFVQKYKIITTSETTTTPGDQSEWHETIYNNASDTKIETYQGYASLRITGVSHGFYINDVVTAGGDYIVTFKVHYVTKNNNGKLVFGNYNVNSDGSFQSASGGLNVWNSDDFQNDGSYSCHITNVNGNIKDLLFKGGDYDDVIVYDIHIQGLDSTMYDNYEDEYITTTTYTDHYIYEWMELDVDRNTDMVLNKSIKDIKEPGTLKNLYSQTFKIPVTLKNSQFFSYLNNDDSISTYDIRKKQTCFLEVNGIDISSGYLSLKKVITESDGSKYFEIMIVGDGIKAFENLSNKKLYELETDSITTNYDEIKGRIEGYINGSNLVDENINYSWALINRGQHSEESNYFNALNNSVINVGNKKGLLVNDLTPVFTLTYILTKMCADEGYTIGGSLLQDNNFKNMVLPLFSSTITDDILTDDDYLFNSKLNFTRNFYTELNQNKSGDFYLLGEMACTSTEAKNVSLGSQDYVNWNTTTNAATPSIQSVSPCNTSGFFYFTPPKFLRAALTLEGTIKVNVSADDAHPASDFWGVHELELYVFYPYGTDGTNVSIEKINEFPSQLIYKHGSYDDSKWLITGENTANIKVKLPYILFYPEGTYADANNYKRNPYFGFRIKTKEYYDTGDGTPCCGVQTMKFAYTFDLTLSSKVEDTTILLSPETTIENPLRLLGDKDVTQMDFIKSLSQMFNLYITTDFKNKIIKFDKQTDFYENELIDLTHKILLNKPITKEFISDLIPRETIFELKSLDDVRTINYKREFLKSPGSYIFNSDNDFAKDKTNITTKNAFWFNKSYFMRCEDGTYNTTEFNIAECKRNITDSDIEDVHKFNDITLSFLFYSNNANIGGLLINDFYLTKQNLVPVPLLSSTNDEMIIGFSTPEVTYSNINNIVYDNFFNKYWFDSLKYATSNESFLITADFWIDALDFVNLNLNSRIKIDNQIFYINKISNWNPNKPTKMELIKYIYGSTSLINTPIIIQKIISETKKTGSNNTLSKNNLLSNSDNTTISGIENNVKSSSYVILSGEKNKVVKSSSVNLENSNNSEVMNSTNITLINCESVKVTNSSNLTIIGENGTIYDNNIFIINNINLTIINSGGEDVVQEEFTDSGIIDGGYNYIYSPDWKETYKIEDGGENNF